MTKQMQVFNFYFYFLDSQQNKFETKLIFYFIFDHFHFFFYHTHQQKYPDQNIREHKNKKFVEINSKEIVCVYLTKQIV